MFLPSKNNVVSSANWTPQLIANIRHIIDINEKEKTFKY